MQIVSIFDSLKRNENAELERRRSQKFSATPKSIQRWLIQVFVFLKAEVNFKQIYSQINETQKHHIWGGILDVNPCSSDVFVTDHIVNKMG